MAHQDTHDENEIEDRTAFQASPDEIDRYDLLRQCETET